MVYRSKGSCGHFFLFCAWRFEECGRNISIPLYISFNLLNSYIYLTFLCFCPGIRYMTSQTTVKKDIKKEEAEELKAKLEAVGATIEIV